jgi:hypothetical protein
MCRTTPSVSLHATSRWPLAFQLSGNYLSDLTPLPFLVLSHEIAIFQCGLASCQNRMDASALNSEL